MAHFNKKYCFVDNRHTEKFFKGLAEDLETLRREFITISDPSFESFAGVWRKLKFASIWGVRTSATEIMEFLQGVFHYIKGYIFAETLPSSVFGVYVVYAVFFKQPIKNKTEKLRLTYDEFCDLLPMLEEMRDCGHHDAVAIFVRLYESGGIHFVASALEPGMEMGYRKYFAKSEDDAKVQQEHPRPPFDPSLLETFDEALQVYTAKKKEQFKDDEAFSGTTDFLKKMREMLSHIGTDVVEDEDATEVDVDVGSLRPSIGVARKKLKIAAFQMGSTASPVEDNEKVTKTKDVRPRTLADNPEPVPTAAGQSLASSPPAVKASSSQHAESASSSQDTKCESPPTPAVLSMPDDLG